MGLESLGRYMSQGLITPPTTSERVPSSYRPDSMGVGVVEVETCLEFSSYTRVMTSEINVASEPLGGPLTK